MRKLSAKDIAFDKERQKLNKKIRLLTDELETLKEENSKYKEKLLHQDTKINEYEGRIERLLEYIDSIDGKDPDAKKILDMMDVFQGRFGTILNSFIV